MSYHDNHTRMRANSVTDVAYERGVQVNRLTMALEDIARTSSCRRSAERARLVLAQVGDPYPLDREGAA
ncbi:hypothetical protein [Ruegeria sp. TM1040]|uniref:hypothetical protein n=1 Tax=Ruegeria sp. (strain TM1040) TaxID=292414 RepID=UPI0000462664|nr:hypothetical protein [Ruegeria sp. TM1040]